MKCLSFKTAVGGIEPLSPRLTVRRSTMRPPFPILTALFCSRCSILFPCLLLHPVMFLCNKSHIFTKQKYTYV
ncbi:hypothetical protein NP493_392g03000 [Ridgeia piscesae]|uniref:Uncharacterized protein n=1 Tax=Ridgeia piscesae TaxID=27915 RepID=A0AAD9L1D6_RIDPI|nr:hypothetical protein NP493_392g03000 [Ridgeia piscesae]